MWLKKFYVDVDSVDYDDLDSYDDDYADDDKYRRTGSIRRLFNRDYYKLKRTDYGFGGRRNNYIEYTSRGDRYENLSPEKYLDMIRPYLKDLINYHKPTTRLSNEENNSDTNETTNSDDERGEWKIQLVMQNNCISIKSFEDTRTVYSASKPVEVFVGSNTDDATDALFDTVLQRFQKAIETSNDNGSGFTNEYIALLYYNFQKIDIQRAESYISRLIRN